ncbi:MAG: SRPBCC family protein [Acidimicrobiales bacterium]|nr:SRPBCC family protein [Acidimicrobiales bacterium]MCB1262880.1 SRPBCC family protein [Acidimicrobiales bacterium]
MTEQARETITIAAPVAQVFATLVDFERYPEWAGDLKAARVVERDDEGRGIEVEFRAAAMGRSTTYRLRYDFADAPNRIGWTLAEGDLQRELDGNYHLQPATDDPDATDIVYELSIDLMVPIPGFVKRRAESRIVRTALEDLRDRVESGA